RPPRPAGPAAPAAPQAVTPAPPPIDAARPIPVGLLLPLSSPDARTQALAADLEAAARLAAAESRVALTVHDDGGDPAGAAAAARRATSAGAAILLGPLFSAQVAAVRPVAEATGVPVISFSSDAAAGAPPVWVMGELPAVEADRIVAYAASRGLGSLALVRPNTDYGALVDAAVHEAARRHGARVVATLPYDRSFDGVQAAIGEGAGRIRDGGADAVVIADGGDALRAVAAFLAFNDVMQPRVRFLGLGQWDSRATQAESVLHGGWFAAADPDVGADFRARFREATGREPNPLAALGYDAVNAVAAMAGRGAGGFDAGAIASPRGFDGARGAFRLTPDGANRRALAVLQVGADGFRVLDPAPSLAPGS
ncbi:MAG: penicillin-binding protein activator, partial [Rhodobacteraceae bacterium]